MALSNCGNCKFWAEVSIGGECRIRAPSIVRGMGGKKATRVVDEDGLTWAEPLDGIWPNTDNAQWCGEFQEAV